MKVEKEVMKRLVHMNKESSMMVVKLNKESLRNLNPFKDDKNTPEKQMKSYLSSIESTPLISDSCNLYKLKNCNDKAQDIFDQNSKIPTTLQPNFVSYPAMTMSTKSQRISKEPDYIRSFK